MLTDLLSSGLALGGSHNNEKLTYQGAPNSRIGTGAVGLRTYSLPGCQGSGSLSPGRAASMMPFSTREKGPTGGCPKTSISTPGLQAKSSREGPPLHFQLPNFAQAPLVVSHPNL